MQGGHQHPSRNPLLHVARRGWLVASLALFCLGVLFLGQGLYIKAKAALAQSLLEDAWDTTLVTGASTKPWPWFDSWPVAKIHVPRLDQSTIVLKSTSGQAMAFGPGHMSATPTPGMRGLSVITAHRDTHFAFLKDVQVGDVIDVTNADGSTHHFTVTGTAIRNAYASGLDPYMDGTHIALVTCYPFDALTQGDLRYIVFGEKTSRS